MNTIRVFILLVAATVATSAFAADSDSGNPDTMLVPPPAATPAYQTDYLLLAPALSSSQLGLRPQWDRARTSVPLPFGLNYNEETKILSMPIDQKNEWGVGLNLDLIPSRSIELAPPSSPLGLQPRRAAGFMLQKRF